MFVKNKYDLNQIDDNRNIDEKSRESSLLQIDFFHSALVNNNLYL